MLSHAVQAAEPYASPVPRQVYSETLAKQEKELKTNAQMLRFAASRKRLAADLYRPACHEARPRIVSNN